MKCFIMLRAAAKQQSQYDVSVTCQDLLDAFDWAALRRRSTGRLPGDGSSLHKGKIIEGKIPSDYQSIGRKDDREAAVHTNKIVGAAKQ
jgi:hypothetical protein